MKKSPNQDTAKHYASKNCAIISQSKLEDEITKGRKELEGLLG
jgi:hypothetical protein